MNIFSIIGPVMIGPSSSHTAGAVRIGRVCNKIMGNDEPVKVTIELSGSFARTYKGHGTDRALLSGIMGYQSYSEETRNALEIAKQRGIDYNFILTDIPGAHPNTARIHAFGKSGKEYTICGSSIGGGNIRITNINGLDVDFTGENNTLLVFHYDKPGLVAAVTHVLTAKYKDINIGNFKLSRPVKGGEALMTIELDNSIPDEVIDEIKCIPNIITAMLIQAV